MTPSPISAASIDTLISSTAWFSTALLAVISAFGIFLVWNGFVLRARAEKDLERIDETARKSEKIFAEYKQRADKAFEAADELILTLISVASKAKEHGKKVEATAEEAQKQWEKIKTAYLNASQGTAILGVAASYPPYANQGSVLPYPFNPSVYANPNTQTPESNLTTSIMGEHPLPKI